MDTKTGQLVTITEWTLKWRHACRKLDADEQTQEEKDAAKYMKQVRRPLPKIHKSSLVQFTHLEIVRLQRATLFSGWEY